MLLVCEIFRSIQGEGQFAGTPSAFVRTSGCNLRCWFCDTPYASWQPEGQRLSWQEVADRLTELGCEHVVVTGGEPLLQPDVVPLTRELAGRGHVVTVETAGTVDRPVHADLLSVSPKLSNSTPRSGRWRERHERLRNRRDVVQALLARYPNYQLKFVVDRPEDVAEVDQYVQALGAPAERVWLMPQATTRFDLAEKTAWLRQEAARRGYQLSPRLQIERFGNRRGT